MSEPLTYAQAVEAARTITNQIRAAEQKLRAQITEAADAEGVYRKQLALASRKARETGATVAEAETQARAQTAPLARDRDVAQGSVRACLEELEDRRGERATLHRLIDWSIAREKGGGGGQ